MKKPSRPRRPPKSAPSTDATAPVAQEPAASELAAAEFAFNALRDRLAAIPNDRVEPLRADAQRVVSAALRVARENATGPARARFERLAAAGEFDLAHLDGLADAALALWFTRRRAMNATATESEAKLTPELEDEATKVHERMLDCVTYLLRKHRDDGPLVAQMRKGRGHAQLANDLASLAELYQRHHALVSRDPINYREGDAAAAQTAAHEIMKVLNKRDVQPEWLALSHRAWSHLAPLYREVSAAGRYTFRDDDPEGRFPNLLSEGRPGPSKSAKAESEKTEGEKTEGEKVEKG